MNGRCKLTLCVQEVLHRDLVRAIDINRRMSEDVLSRAAECLLRILVTKGSQVVANVCGTLVHPSQMNDRSIEADGGTYQLLLQRDLLELHTVHASIGTTEQRSGCDDESVLHTCNHQTLS